MSALAIIGTLAVGCALGEIACRVEWFFRKRAHKRLVAAAYGLGVDAGYEDGRAGVFRFAVVGLPVSWDARWSAERRAVATLACCDQARRTGWLYGFAKGDFERQDANLKAHAEAMVDKAERYANGGAV